MIDDIHYLGGIKLPTGGFLSQLTDVAPQNNQTVLQGMAAGHPQPLFTAIMGAKPAAEFTTTQIKTALDALGLFGLDTSGGNTDFLWRRGANLGARQPDSGGDHKRLRAAAGLLYWLELTANYQEEAMLRCRYKPISTDGETAPWIPAGSLSLTDVPTGSERFTLGKTYLNGVQIRGVKTLRLALNPTMTEEGADDNLFDTYCGIEEVRPTVTLEGLSWAQWTAQGLMGDAIEAPLEIYFRRKLADGAHVAIGTASHIRIRGLAGLAYAAGSRGGNNTPSTTGVEIPLRATSGSGNVLEINTATTSV